jgi:ATP-dependent DNA helicase DinG
MNMAVGFAIIDNNLINCYIIIPPKSIIKRKKIKDLEVEKIFKDPSQSLLNILPNYKIRESQIELSKLMLNIINDDKVGFIEAPTGIGKSLAYLIPSFLYIKKNKVKIIISTYTKNLQNQLIKKDIPSVIKILNQNLSIEVAYGRQNYLCLLSYSNFKENFNFLFYESVESEVMQQLEEWVKKTNDGLLLELSGNYEKKIIDEIRSNSNLCLSNKCKFFNECFYYSARRRLNNADIIVTNHHLLLSYELSEDFSDFFPIYNTIIFDEGHNLPDVIESISTYTFSTFEIQKKLFKLAQNTNKKKGLLQLLDDNLSKSSLKNTTVGKKIVRLAEDIQNQVVELQQIVSNIQNLITYEIINLINSSKIDNSKSKTLVNLTDLAKRNPEILKAIYDFLEESFENIKTFTDSASLLLTLLDIIFNNEEKKDTEFSFLQYLYGNIRSAVKFFLNINEFYIEFQSLLSNSHQISNNQKIQKYLKVLWFEISNNIINFYFYNEEKGLTFNDIIKTKAKSSIFISATLATENSFDYIKEQLALTEDIKKSCIDRIFPSIFPYDKNSSLFIIKGINPLDRFTYKNNISDIILQVLSSTKAKTMILTTAYSDINDISEAVRKSKKEINLLVQNNSSINYTLLDEFKKDKKSVLLVNMGFWEGIDLIGKNLEILIISKLPFKVPDTPVLKAKTERLDNLGENSFFKLSLPYAIIKIKQGFGRLIRSEEETGICILLDDRVISKNYGYLILNSLPNAKLEIIEKDEFLDKFISRCKELEIY